MHVSMRMQPHVFRYIMMVFLIGLSPQRTNPVWMYSNYSLEESDDKYNVLNPLMLETYAASIIFIYVPCMRIITVTPFPDLQTLRWINPTRR